MARREKTLITLEHVMVFSEQERAYLRLLLQNPTDENESGDEYDLRTSLFDALTYNSPKGDHR